MPIRVLEQTIRQQGKDESNEKRIRSLVILVKLILIYVSCVRGTFGQLDQKLYNRQLKASVLGKIPIAHDIGKCHLLA